MAGTNPFVDCRCVVVTFTVPTPRELCKSGSERLRYGLKTKHELLTDIIVLNESAQSAQAARVDAGRLSWLESAGVAQSARDRFGVRSSARNRLISSGSAQITARSSEDKDVMMTTTAMETSRSGRDQEDDDDKAVTAATRW